MGGDSHRIVVASVHAIGERLAEMTEIDGVGAEARQVDFHKAPGLLTFRYSSISYVKGRQGTTDGLQKQDMIRVYRPNSLFDSFVESNHSDLQLVLGFVQGVIPSDPSVVFVVLLRSA